MNLRLFSISFLLATISYGAFGQVNIGIKLSPGIAPTRTSVLSDTMTLQSESKPVRILAGLVLDYSFKENYGFRSGVNFISKKVKYDVRGDTPGVRYNDEVIAQYLQIPLTLKLTTNEVTLDSKVYIQLGASLDIKVHDDLDEQDNTLVTKMNFVDTSMIVAAGLDMKLGTDTRVFGGIVYQRAFLNQATETLRLDKDFTFQTGFVGLEAGIIF